MNQIELLWQLQNLDSQMNRLEKKLDASDIKEQLKKIKLMFEAEKEKMAYSKELLKNVMKEIRSNKTKAEELKYNYQKTEEKLYSGVVSSAKQLEAMQKNLDEMQNSIQNLENKGKILQEEAKRLDEANKRSRIKLLKCKNSFDSMKKEYTVGREEAGKEYETFKKQRQALLKKINKGLLKRYNRVRLGTDTAVVLLEDGKCSGCHMEVSVLCMEHLKEGNYVSCETCGRILYYKDN